jgi:hypothetical protein
MNLIQKLCEPFDGLRTETAKELEKITDDFAIGFAEWILNKAEKYNEYLYEIQDLKELLEIYKKEKEL